MSSGIFDTRPLVALGELSLLIRTFPPPTPFARVWLTEKWGPPEGGSVRTYFGELDLDEAVALDYTLRPYGCRAERESLSTPPEPMGVPAQNIAADALAAFLSRCEELSR